MTEDSPKELTLYDQLRLYPDIVLNHSIDKSRSKLKDLLSRVNNPRENDDVGLVLEDLAEVLLESPYFRLNKKRRRCETGEIDLDFNVRKFPTTLFDEFSYLLIVECKNWSKKARASDLRVFCSKMRNVESNVGIFFSKQGITRDARGVIRQHWFQDKIVVIIFDSKDLEQIINGSKNLYEVLNQKYLAVRTASN